MVNKILILSVTLLFALILNSCGSRDNTQPEGMARFTQDSGFKNSHDIPEPISISPRGEMISFPTNDGHTATAYVMRPAESKPEKLLVFHEWWGLNDHIRLEAEHLFDSLGIEVWALDLYDGKVATDRDQAGMIMKSRKQERLESIVSGAIQKMGPDARIATIGWCFGGTWSLKASILAGAQGVACVFYYGMPVQRADELAPLQAPVLGLFADKDTWINQDVAQQFDALCKATGKSFEWVMYPGDHAFANPSSSKYFEASAQQANARSLRFLRSYLLRQ